MHFMRVKIFFLISAFLLSAYHLSASPVSKVSATNVAVNFLTEKYAQSDKYWQSVIPAIRNIIAVDNAYFIINFNEGWVIVSAEDVIKPVIGYSFQDNINYPFDNNSTYANYMQHFADQADFIRVNVKNADAEVALEWEHYLDNDFQVTADRREAASMIDPLLTSKWDQDFPYNYYCPEDTEGPGGHVLVGCVATAMAQIMYYWRYPLQGSGSHSYYIYPYGTQTVDFGNSQYFYNAMQDKADVNNPFAVAEISYHAAVSVNMDFDPEGSGAYSADVPNAMESYFNYHTDCEHVKKSDYQENIWEEMIKSELDQLRPVYYAGRNADNSGHAFVCDGYDEDNYYHFNFGWNGNGNGYYTIEDVNGFQYFQAMVYKIYPEDSGYPYIASGVSNLTSLSGSFTDGSGPFEYPPGTSAQWLISPQTQTDSIVSIKLNFKDIKLNILDQINVYDGASEEAELIASYHGDTVPNTIYSSGNKLFIDFSSTNTGAGFMAEYESVMPIYCAAIETISDSSGFITDGSGSFNYRSNTSCLFKFTQPDQVDYTFEIIDFKTESGKDKITFFNKNQDVLGELSGYLSNEVYHFQTDELYILWSTNARITDKGWKIKYTVNGINSLAELKLDHLSIYPNPTNSSLNVSFNIEKTETLEVQLIHLNGKVLQSELLNGFSGTYYKQFNLSGYPKGVYVLSIISSKGKVDKKVVLSN